MTQRSPRSPGHASHQIAHGEEVEFFLSCQDLVPKNVYVIAYLKDNLQNKWNKLGETDVSQTENPHFATQFQAVFIFEEEQVLRFDVFNTHKGKKVASNKYLVGSTTTKLSEVLHANSQVLARTLNLGASMVKNKNTKRYTRITIRLEPIAVTKDTDIVELELHGDGMKIGGLSKANPILEIHRLGPDGKYFKVLESEVVRKSNQPQWPMFRVSSQLLCNNDELRTLQLKVYNQQKNWRQYMAKTHTNLKKLKAKFPKAYNMKDIKGKGGYKIKVQQCRITETIKGKEDLSKKFNLQDEQKKLKKAKQKDAIEQQNKAKAKAAAQKSPGITRVKSIKGLTDTQKMIRATQETISKLAQGKFLQYLKGGCEISLMVAIDFTGTNGMVTDPKSLHYLYGNKPSPYQKAIRNICSIVSPYDSDNLFPVWGFGVKFAQNDRIINDFSLDPEGKEVEGVAGIEQAYVTAVQSNAFQLGGPTCYSNILGRAISAAQESHKTVINNKDEKLQYYILLVITNGMQQKDDQQKTKDLLVYASNNNLPLSIIFVGVGNSEFEFLNELDGDFEPIKDSNGTPSTRDIVQFVCMDDFKNESKHALSKYTLREVPIQFVSYVDANNILPRENKVMTQANNVDEKNDDWYKEDENNDTNNEFAIADDDLKDDETVVQPGAANDDDETKNDNDNPFNDALNSAPDTEDELPLPFGWEKSFFNGRVFYIDHKNRKTQWEHPLKNKMKISKPNNTVQKQQNKQQALYMNQLVNSSSITMQSLQQQKGQYNQSKPQPKPQPKPQQQYVQQQPQMVQQQYYQQPQQHQYVQQNNQMIQRNNTGAYYQNQQNQNQYYQQNNQMIQRNNTGQYYQNQQQFVQPQQQQYYQQNNQFNQGMQAQPQQNQYYQGMQAQPQQQQFYQQQQPQQQYYQQNNNNQNNGQRWQM